MTASRSCLSQDQRNPTVRSLPDWRVEGATPARQASDSGVGKRARQSPISASRRAARARPGRGRVGKAGQAGEHVLVCVQRELLADLGGQCLDLLVEGDQYGPQGAGDVRFGGTVL